MKKQALAINGIPAIVWEEDSQKVLIAIHGNMSHKEDTVIELLEMKQWQKDIRY
ncbi:hypothetical protein [Isobaculum melis]|uniref:Uncharacterized protein n=1 Tax=Isobaculum melis TaxID=142588 RepID=A0A1H9Q3K7_9LACT|nr:hypothetical protein [Isobaculum melis]SER54998.1 hypothetical protein SAMN04488559_101325 [Isobaculum melis]